MPETAADRGLDNPFDPPQVDTSAYRRADAKPILDALRACR